MKIWEAILVLGINDEDKYVTRFNFELVGDKFKENDKSWSYADGWLVKAVSKDIDIYENYGNVVAKQGFTRELSENEQKEIESNMKKHLIKYLKLRQKQIYNTYEKKIDAIEVD